MRLSKIMLGIAFVSVSIFCKSQEISSPRFFKLNIQNLGAPTSLLSPGLSTYSSTEYEVGTFVEAQLRFPVKMTGNVILFGEVEYNREGLSGFHKPELTDDEEIILHRAKLSFSSLSKLNNDWQLVNRLGFSSGSNRLFCASSMHFSSTNLLLKSFANGSLGGGLRLSYGNHLSLIPLLKYETKISEKWSIDILLPIQLQLVKQLSKEQRFFLGAKGMAAEYFLTGDDLDQTASSSFRRLSVKAGMGYERQISKLLGVSIEVGNEFPLSSGVYVFEKNWQSLHQFRSRSTPYLKLGFFLSVDR